MTLFPDLLLMDSTLTRDIEGATHDMALMLQGVLLAASGSFVADRLTGDVPAIVQQPVGERGEVQPYFRIMLANGVNLRVHVEIESNHR